MSITNAGAIQLLFLLVQQDVLLQHWAARERSGREDTDV